MIPLNFTLPVAGPVAVDLDATVQSCQADNDAIQLTVFVVDPDGNPINLRAATSRKIALLAPDGTAAEFDAPLLTSGVDGALRYETAAEDLAEKGTYQIQAKYTIGGNAQTTRWGEFRVGANIVVPEI